MKAVIFMLFAMTTSTVWASSYFHECRNSSGTMAIYDGGLESVSDGLPIDYQKLSESILEEKQETCFSSSANSSFSWGFKKYLLKIRYSFLGSDDIDEYFICEEAFDGIPAGVSDCK